MEQHEHVEQKHEHVDPNYERPTTVSKETYYSVKRDPLQCQNEHVDPNYELGTEQQHKDDGQQRHVQLEQANILND
jgi:hypothetical protein